MSLEHEEHSGDSDGFAGYHVNMVPWTSIWPATFIRSFPPVFLCNAVLVYISSNGVTLVFNHVTRTFL